MLLSRFVPAFAPALVGPAEIWVDAPWHGMPRGLEQRIVIAMILAWLLLAAHWLRDGMAVAQPSGCGAAS